MLWWKQKKMLFIGLTTAVRSGVKSVQMATDRFIMPKFIATRRMKTAFTIFLAAFIAPKTAANRGQNCLITTMFIPTIMRFGFIPMTLLF